MQRYAILDLGTNTFNLLVAEHDQQGWKTLHIDRIPSRLGKGGMNSGAITPEAFERGLTAIKQHQSTALQFGDMTFFAFATSMMRDASNGKDFVAAVKQETGIDIHVIDGEREAELICKGVLEGFSSAAPFLIMDIGGGSTEFILVHHRIPVWKKSYRLGVTRLFEQFPHADPIREPEVEAVVLHLQKELPELIAQLEKHQVRTLVGSAGSFESYAEIIHRRMFRKPLDLSIPSHEIPNQDFLALLDEFIRSNHSERARIDGLIEFRRDLIVMASVLIHFLVNSHSFERVFFSAYSMKEGILSELKTQG